MPKTWEPWERCAANGFSGIHLWELDVERNQDGSRKRDGAQIATCRVCHGLPDRRHAAQVVQDLLAFRDDMRAYAARRELSRPGYGKSRR